MNLEQFVNELKTKHTYETPDAICKHPRIKTDFGYYLEQCRVVRRCNIVARRDEWCRPTWLYMSHQMWRNVEFAGGKSYVSGIEHIQGLNQAPCVVVGNHMSMLETVTVPSLVIPFFDLNMVIKRRLMTYPVFGRVMQTIAPIAVDRTNPREDLKVVLTEGVKRLEMGKSILMFPQSTRTPIFDPGKFNSLGAKLAKRAGVPLVPLALKTDFQGIGRILRDAGPLDRSKSIHYTFGPPLTVTGTGKNEQEMCIEFIRSHVIKWGGQVAD